ncbi:hypothetical protein NDU88_001160 [Pleurodeles waltl]|uniref:Uncharacterized protein n=1 Tax=Pleurodeles waltl TaxID=8319 RepID=A0AAV7MKR0_PLEWA|nr:hypothetical protein NDU88_001160 [Pleurodeles waltl]
MGHSASLSDGHGHLCPVHNHRVSLLGMVLEYRALRFASLGPLRHERTPHPRPWECARRLSRAHLSTCTGPRSPPPHPAAPQTGRSAAPGRKSRARESDKREPDANKASPVQRLGQPRHGQTDSRFCSRLTGIRLGVTSSTFPWPRLQASVDPSCSTRHLSPPRLLFPEPLRGVYR